MANIPESPIWGTEEEHVYQLATNDRVRGGPSGVDNKQAKVFANRTRWLRQELEGLQTDIGYLDMTIDNLNTQLEGKEFYDNDDLSPDSDNGIASQQSIKKYVDDSIQAIPEPIADASESLRGKVEMASEDEVLDGEEHIPYVVSPLMLQRKLDTLPAGLDTVAILSLIYPVGSIYTNADDDTNPEILLGFGTWVPFGEGRVLVTKHAGLPYCDTLGETGGSSRHTLTINEMPSHTHTYSKAYNDSTPGGSGYEAGGRDGCTTSTSAAGSGYSHNNLQPYIVVCMWRRTL